MTVKKQIDSFWKNAFVTLTILLVILLFVMPLTAFDSHAASYEQWEDCDWDGYDDHTGVAVPWPGFDGTRGDTPAGPSADSQTGKKLAEEKAAKEEQTKPDESTSSSGSSQDSKEKSKNSSSKSSPSGSKDKKAAESKKSTDKDSASKQTAAATAGEEKKTGDDKATAGEVKNDAAETDNVLSDTDNPAEPEPTGGQLPMSGEDDDETVTAAALAVDTAASEGAGDTDVSQGRFLDFLTAGFHGDKSEMFAGLIILAILLIASGSVLIVAKLLRKGERMNDLLIKPGFRCTGRRTADSANSAK